jgi:transposase
MAKRRQNKPVIVASLPGETAEAAKTVFNIENVYLTIGDRLEDLLKDIALMELDAVKVFHPEMLTQLALMTIFQFAEDLADRPACTALQRRMDWKYAVHLPLQQPRLNPAWLCRFRQPLIGRPEASLQPLGSLLDRLATMGLLGRDKRDTPAPSVLEHVCRLNQLDRLHKDVSQAIEVLACHQPDMLRTLVQPHWYNRYREGREFRPRSTAEQRACAQTLGSDACHLLEAIAQFADPLTRELPEVRRLSEVWAKRYALQGTTVFWREARCELCPWLPPEEVHADVDLIT